MGQTPQPLQADQVLGLRRSFAGDERPREELEQLFELIGLLAQLPPPPDPLGLYPSYEPLRRRLVGSLGSPDPEQVEEALLELYCHLHGTEAPYTPAERAVVDETGGYWCHAGGLSPLIKAGPWIGPETISSDFGAGNGLQGLLLQKLHPHACTVQIEISSRMVEAGQSLQRWLSIPPDRVRWLAADVRHVPPTGMGFIYLYRPVKPVGLGKTFYEQFAEQLSQSREPVVIFSIADCLKDYLPAEFEIFYNDGHLTCFRRGVAT
jgi:hypothetical protein